ncbi:MAG: protein ImuB [Acidobacteriaceae bacterium]|nr:protein ImuB [Acidobacteriaceae bacterium]
MNQPAELYACLYAREFPAQTLLRLRPELHSKPCVVMKGEPPLQQVCSLNTKARLLGMTHGMTRVEVDTFPEPVLLCRSHKEEMAVRTILLECAGGFSPRVEDRSEDTAFLCVIDIAGTKALFGPPEMLVRNLLECVRSLGISARVTVSSNFHAAVCLARGLSPSTPFRMIAPGDEPKALASLPLTVLDLKETQAETFAVWGIHTLGMLAALPEKELIARMGQEGKRLQQLARGELSHLFQPVEAAFLLEEKMELDSPVELLDSLLFVIGVMLDQLILRAKARILALASVTIVLTLDGGGTHTRTVRPALPTTDKQLWIKLLHLDLEAHPPQAAILALTLTAEPGSTSKVQLGLFSPQLPEAARLDVTLARIRAIVGEECVGRAVLQDTLTPENFRAEPFTVPSRDSAGAIASQPRASMRRLRPPETTSVTLQNRRPSMFFFRERRYTVERTYGPWLTGSDWWNQTLWGFEQWDLVARAQDGGMICCCMTRDLMQNLWQMVALYD